MVCLPATNTGIVPCPDGRAQITLNGDESEDGKPIELKAGDVFVIEPGFKATWEVVERVRKYYVFVLS
jgi:uncharacterized cupin superfamily protein